MAIKYDKNGRPYEEVDDPAALIDAGRAAGLRQAAQAPAAGLGQELPSSGTGRQVAAPTGAYNGAGATQQPISYENAGSYLSANQAAIDELRGRILGRGAFAYDYTTDPRWQAYRKEYVREGQRAAADTLGQAAALTGGRPSTAAITASQQAGNYYAAQLADKIPELYAAAYDVWQDADSRDRANLGLLLDADQTAYERGLEDRNWQYQLDRDAVEDARWREQFNYGRERDAVADAQWWEKFNYGRQQDALSNSLALAKIGMDRGDYSLLKNLGFSDEQIASYAQKYQEDKQAAVAQQEEENSIAWAKALRGGKGSTAGTNSENVWAGLEDYIRQYGDDADVEGYLKANRKAMGFSSYEEAEAAWKLYNQRQQGDDTEVGRRRVMREAGVPESEINKIPSREAWKQMKDLRMNTIYTQGYDTYEDFYADYTEWLISKYGG